MGRGKEGDERRAAGMILFHWCRSRKGKKRLNFDHWKLVIIIPMY